MDTLQRTRTVGSLVTPDSASGSGVGADPDCVTLSGLTTTTPPWGRCRSLTDIRRLLPHPGIVPDEGLLGREVRKPRILIVDDEPAVVTFIERALRLESDYELATASDGFEAAHQLATFQPDLVVLDIMLPGISGFEICRRARADRATQHVKILAVTGFATDENIEQILRDGANDYLEKPLTLADLRDKVHRLLASQR